MDDGARLAVCNQGMCYKELLINEFNNSDALVTKYAQCSIIMYCPSCQLSEILSHSVVVMSDQY